MPNTIQTLTEEIGEVMAQLNQLVQATAGTKTFVNALGWELPPGVDDIGLTAIDFSNLLAKLKIVVESSEAESEDELLMAVRIADLGLAIGATADSVRQLAQSLALTLGGFGDYLDRTNIHKELPRRLIDLQLINYLSERSPLATAILNFLNIIEFRYFPADEENFQLEHLRAIVNYGHLKTFISDPAGHLSDTYGWGTPEFADIVLLGRIGQILRELGLPLQLRMMDPRAEAALVGPPPTGPDVRPVPQMLVTIYEQLEEVAGLKLGLSVFGVRPSSEGTADGGVGFLPIVRGQAQASIPFFAFDDAFIDLSADADLLKRTALILRPDQELEVKTANDLSDTVTGRFALGLRHGSATSEAKTLLSFPGGVALQAQQIHLLGGMEKYSERPAESFMELGLLGGRVVF